MEDRLIVGLGIGVVWLIMSIGHVRRITAQMRANRNLAQWVRRAQ